MFEAIRVSSLLARALYEAVQVAGVEGSSLFVRSNLDFQTIAARGFITLVEFDLLLNNAVKLTRDDSFGLHWALRSPMVQFELPMALINAAPTLREAVQSILQVQALFANREQAWFSEHETRAVLSFDLLAITDTGKRVMTELALGGVMRLIHYRADARALRRINVSYAEPPNAPEYEPSLGVRVHFGQPQTSFEFATSALPRVHNLSNEGRFARIREDAAKLRKVALDQLSCSEQLEGQIRAALPRVLTMQEAALAGGTSERSLRRRLADEGARYSDLVDAVQRTRAHELLAMGDKTVKEMATALGFANSSTFIRAYRRWTGNSPGQDSGPARPKSVRTPLPSPR